MAIGVAQDPAAARAAANIAFADRQLPVDRNFADVPDKGAEVGSLPLYNLAVSDLARADFNNARHTGWRYVRIQHSSRIGDAIEADLADEPTIVAHSGGETAARLRDAGKQALEDISYDDPADTDYSARILRVPEIGIEALCLWPRGVGARPRFFGLPASQAHLINEAFVDYAVRAATQYLERLASMTGGG